MEKQSTMSESTSTAEEVLELFKIEGQSVVPVLFQTWEEIGYDKDTITKFGSEVFNHYKTLLGDMLMESQSRKGRLLEDIETMAEKISILSKELKMDVNLNYRNDSLVIVESKLRNHLKEIQSIKENRLTYYKQLLEKELEICQVMGMKAVGLDSTLPSEMDLKNFKLYITKQEEEVIELKKVFTRIRGEIMELVEELSFKPTLEFERIVCKDYDNFVYTGSNMTKLREFRDRLQEKLDSLKELAENKRQELISLWEYLDVSEAKYKMFLEKNSGFDAATISALNKEIKTCKEVRKENMAKYVNKVREEIVKLWDMCRIGQAQREAFHPFHYETFNEDTLAIHEMEVYKLRKYYDDNEKIFEVLNQEKEMFTKFKEMLLREDDPNRLHNRGGQLLEEEKQRKLINKNLPKIAEQLNQLFRQYEEKHGEPFLIDGLTYEELRAQQLEQLNEEKENVKVARARAKDEKKPLKKTPLSASRRHVGLTTTLRSAHTSVKRKIATDGSPILCSNKKRMFNSEKAPRPTALGSKIRRSGQTHVSRRLLSSSFNSSKGTSQKKANKSRITVTDASESIIVSPYEEFQNGLANRDELRSTLVSDELLKIPHANKKKTPVKTPAKPLRKRPGVVPSQGTPRSLVTPRPSRSPKITSTPRLTTAVTRGEYKF